MPNILEDPTPILVCGILIAAVLGILLVRTGRGVLLWAIIAVAALTGVGLLVERLVVTEREEVEGAIEAAAAAVRANNLDGALAHISPSAGPPRDLVRLAFGRATFEDVKLTHIEIRVIRTTSPPTAKADVKGFAKVRDKTGTFPYGAVPIDGTLEFRRENNRWLVTGYSMKEDPRKG